METNALTLDAFPAQACTDLTRHGIQVEELTMGCIELVAASPDISQERSAEQPEGALLLVFKTVLTGFRRCQSVALEKCSSDA